DIFGRSIFTLPNSGSDSELFYKSALVIANVSNSISGTYNFSIYPKITGKIINLIGPQRLFIQYLNVLLRISTILVLYLILRNLKISTKIRRVIILIITFMPNSIIMSSIFLREAFPTFFVALSLLYFL